jgi:hypothetical protein
MWSALSSITKGSPLDGKDGSTTVKMDPYNLESQNIIVVYKLTNMLQIGIFLSTTYKGVALNSLV